ncbi:MAG: radical SAM protein [Bacteroidales bacterium]|nr:radical SAM protein [Bacteroidales bacterium]
MLLKDASAFLDDFSKKSYTDIFNIRSRVEQKDWERNAITNIKEHIFQGVNKYSTTKNVLYVHIPFCATRCDYCPYYTTPYNHTLVNEYISCLKKEMNRYKNTPYLKSTTFSSVYFGGGTPSILTVEQIKEIGEHILNSFTFDSNAELSFESNPSTLTLPKIKILKSLGFNRVSLGIQTFNERLLKSMNCAHNKEKGIAVIRQLLENNFIVNADLIFGLTGQDNKDIEEDIRILSQFEGSLQVTYFPLRIAENTPLAKQLETEEELSIGAHLKHLLKIDAFIENKLSSNGFIREECPVFYHSSGASEHKYHSTETRVIGFGSSAGTLLDEAENCNFFDIYEYMKNVDSDSSTALSGIMLTQQQAMERFVLYRLLYMNRSLPNFKNLMEERFFEYYQTPLNDLYEKVLNDMLKLRFIRLNGEKIELTNRFWRILNKVKIGMPSII